MVAALIFDHALLADGWAADVRIEIADGVITQVTPTARRDGADHVAGIAIPGMPNLHCHAFQKGMAGLAERRGPAHDSFWTWREVMYRFLRVLSPDDVEAIAAYAYREMLEAGFTAVGEFHYLHHDPEGRPYNDIAELMARIAAAANETGIGLTLLPSFYAQGGFGGAAPTPGQRRFITDPEMFLRLVGRAQEIAATLPDARVGIAPCWMR
jgi:formimidoylglutamate deiminase